MAILTDDELAVISKYCGNDYVQRYRAILKKNADGNMVRVVNTGMVSSGKSSLFNVFIDSISDEHFPTGAARTTTMADSYRYKNISFIDTPGIDVRSEDDDLAFRTIMEADIIMMVHNIKTGPLNRSEAEWLEKICAGMKDVEMRKSRLIFICTWKDTREKDEDYQGILADVKNMVFQITGTEIPFFDVSVKKYLSGAAKNAEALKESSGMIGLRDYLEAYAKDYEKSKQKMDQGEMRQLADEMKRILNQKKSGKQDEKRKIGNRVRDNFRSKRSAWSSVFDYFSSARKQLEDLKAELDDIQGGRTPEGLIEHVGDFFGKTYYRS